MEEKEIVVEETAKEEVVEETTEILDLGVEPPEDEIVEENKEVE